MTRLLRYLATHSAACDPGWYAQWEPAGERYLGRREDYYDGPLVTWGFWWFSVQWCR